MELRDLLASFSHKNAQVSVIGLGYVGLPLCVALAKAGYCVSGIDLDPFKVNSVNQGISYLEDVSSDELISLVKEGKIKASLSYKNILSSQAVVVCVPTPIDEDDKPDLSCVLKAFQGILTYMHPGLLISLESTTYPGTTRELLFPLFTDQGWKEGKDYFLCFSPERVDPGRKDWDTQTIPKVVGGLTENCATVGSAFYASFLKSIVPVSSVETAEMVKILENSFRAVNIAFANEMLLICEKLNLNIWEIIDAAGTKPFGFMKFFPGPGVGGHCIPVDPLYLTWKLEKLDSRSEFISLAHSVNKGMPKYWADLAIKKLKLREKNLSDTHILLLGVAYKKDVSDIRESPALDILVYLQQTQAKLSYYDPFVPSFSYQGRSYTSENSLENALLKSDLAILLTDHTYFAAIDFNAYECLVLNTRGKAIQQKEKSSPTQNEKISA